MRIALMLGALLGTGMAVPAAAATTVLDFSGPICGVAGGQACGNSAQIVNSYGSTGDVGILWGSRVAPGNSTGVNPYVQYWNLSYADLVDVAYASGGVGEARFVVSPGKTLTLDSVDVGGWPNVNRSSRVLVWELDFSSQLFDTGPIVFPGSTAATIQMGVTTSTGFVFQWGPDSFNGGIDNLTFTVRDSGPPPIPEPATWAMLIAGFGLVGASLRRRKALPAA